MGSPQATQYLFFRRVHVRALRALDRVREAIANFHVLTNYDRLYIGGGNAQILKSRVDPSVIIVGNIAGILGGIKLWDAPHADVQTQSSAPHQR
jgi:polyphosphate glucokinase